jgi:hypothetical protein
LVRDCVLVNHRTLLPVFMPLAPSVTLLDRVPETIASALRRQAAGEEFISAELAAMGEVRIAPTNDRSTIGVMNKFSFLGERLFQRGVTDIEAIGDRLSSMILGPLMSRHGSPDRELLAILQGEPASDLEPPPTTARSSAARPATQRQLLQLKVTLLGVKPPVWRRLIVDSSTSLHQLHEYIQAAFGWWNYHLYEFEIGQNSYGVPDPEWDDGPPVKKAHRTALTKVSGIGDRFRYNYDFGDGWEHEVVVEKAFPSTPGMTVPSCIDGRRACPPEDCGGPWGYQELLTILSDPKHPEHVQRLQWVGSEWGGGRLDPEAFDPAEFTANLDTLRAAALE